MIRTKIRRKSKHSLESINIKDEIIVLLKKIAFTIHAIIQ
jgi:hypothetical protein